MYRPSKDEIVRPKGGLGGLGHVDRKNPTPRPAPRELINGVGNKPPINLSNSPYAQENNSPPNFQTPTLNRAPASPVPQLGETVNVAPVGSMGNTRAFPWKRALFISVLGAISYGGYAYTRNRSLEEFEADEAEDDY